MSKHIIIFMAFTLSVGILSGAWAGNDKPIEYDQLKEMIEDGETTESIVNQIRERGLGFELDNKTKGKLSKAGADSDLMLYLNDPKKYIAKIEAAKTPEYGNLTINIGGSWVYSKENEIPFELAILIEGKKVKSMNQWTRILQVGSMGGGSLYGADYVTKMTLEPGIFVIPKVGVGSKDVSIAMVIGEKNPSDPRLRGSIIFSETVNIEVSQNTMIELEAYNDSKGGFKLQ